MKLDQNLLQKIISESLTSLIQEEGSMGVQQTSSPTTSAQEQIGILNQKLQDVLASNEELQKRFSDLEGNIATKDAEMNNLKKENETLKKQLSAKEGSPTSPQQDQQKMTQGQVPGGSMNTVQESFQISKTRLEEIIKEEMLFAKKQGIL